MTASPAPALRPRHRSGTPSTIGRRAPPQRGGLLDQRDPHSHAGQGGCRPKARDAAPDDERLARHFITFDKGASQSRPVVGYRLSSETGRANPRRSPTVSPPPGPKSAENKASNRGFANYDCPLIMPASLNVHKRNIHSSLEMPGPNLYPRKATSVALGVFL